eukprot:TRINITY_DN7326_c0_g1_i3.p1 TRINITY_DN7326_c0_g1~~TRINITY_DN7326_c0_g1_i3.p1  ORF type:complete len:356 (+),score=60.57 TRINITY_DN7326_c0_g1_i3:496-1563(+)
MSVLALLKASRASAISRLHFELSQCAEDIAKKTECLSQEVSETITRLIKSLYSLHQEEGIPKPVKPKNKLELPFLPASFAASPVRKIAKSKKGKTEDSGSLSTEHWSSKSNVDFQDFMKIETTSNRLRVENETLRNKLENIEYYARKLEKFLGIKQSIVEKVADNVDTKKMKVYIKDFLNKERKERIKDSKALNLKKEITIKEPKSPHRIGNLGTPEETSPHRLGFLSYDAAREASPAKLRDLQEQIGNSDEGRGRLLSNRDASNRSSRSRSKSKGPQGEISKKSPGRGKVIKSSSKEEVPREVQLSYDLPPPPSLFDISPKLVPKVNGVDDVLRKSRSKRRASSKKKKIESKQS